MAEIRNRFNNQVILSDSDKSKKELVEKAVKKVISLDGASLNGASLNRTSLNGASLNGASLDGAFLNGASLNRASLDGASLNGASLNRASLNRASLNGASLDGASLDGAFLNGASLNRASLDGASLNGASLNGASLNRASLNRTSLNGASLDGAFLNGASLNGASLNRTSLNGAKIEFPQFPSIRLISSIPLRNLSDELNLEIMRWNCINHPHPERFDEWAETNENNKCPYQNEEELFHHNPNKKIWAPGPPTMTWPELCMAICKEMKWSIRGYLDIEK